MSLSEINKFVKSLSFTHLPGGVRRHPGVRKGEKAGKRRKRNTFSGSYNARPMSTSPSVEGNQAAGGIPAYLPGTTPFLASPLFLP